MKDLEKIKEFFLKDRAMTAAYEAKEEYFKLMIRKDKNSPSILYVDIAYPEGSGVLSIGGSKTMSGQDRETGAAKALAMGNAVVKKLQAKYNIEDIEVKDLKNGKVQVFAVSDDFAKMSTPSLNENFPGPGEIVDAKYLNNAMLDYFNRMNIKLLINTKTEKGIKGGVGTFYGDLVFGGGGDFIKLKDIVSVEIIESSLDEAKEETGINSGRMIAHKVLNKLVDMGLISVRKKTEDLVGIVADVITNAKMESKEINEAKEEDAVDTITMDVPLFIRMLEYSREDTAEDMDLHNVTEKAILLGKERGILQMDDYEEIVGTTEKMEENVAPNHNGRSGKYGSGYKPLEEKIAKALDQINEELCPAGKAYRKRRIAAGEKSSAYLSGRAVKVCKGQMSGKKKKK